MKLTTGLLLLGLLACAPAHAAVVITPSLFGNASEMPGSGDNYTFFGNPIQFPASGPDIVHNFTTGNANQPTNLTNFTASPGANARFTYGVQNNAGLFNFNPLYSAIKTPGNVDGTQKTGIVYAVTNKPAPDLVKFTLSNTTPNFNFDNFDVFVMISNAPLAGLDDAQLFATLYDPTGTVALASAHPLVIDDTATIGKATFEEFHITGASAGDILELGAKATKGDIAYLSGVSFKSVGRDKRGGNCDPPSDPAPEPSTWAMMILGLAALVFVQRRRVASLL